MGPRAWVAAGVVVALASCQRGTAQDSRAAAALATATVWQAAHDLDRAAALADQAMGTRLDATARQLAGTIAAERDDAATAERLLTEALIAHAGAPLELARDARALTRVLLQQTRLGEALDFAELAARAAHRGGDARLEGFAVLAQAEVLVDIGDEQRARRAFIAAGSLLSAQPRDVAWPLFKHGLFVLELDQPAAAGALLRQALAAARAHGVAPLIDAAHLNLAMAERAQGRTTAAQAELAAVSADSRDSASARYVAGLVAADRGDRATAERLLGLAAADPADDDYAWQIADARGALAEAAADLPAAEQRYREAIAVVEAIRGRSATLELRPWILAKRRRPYEALFTLLATRHRDADALAIAEQLHARTWLDAVIEQTAPRDRDALRAPATPPLGTAALTAALGDRDAMVYVTTQAALWAIEVRGGGRDGARGEVRGGAGGDARPVARDTAGGDAGAAAGGDARGVPRRAPAIRVTRLDDRVAPLLARWRDHPDDAALAAELGPLLVPAELAASPRPLYIVAPGAFAELPLAALRRGSRLLIEDRAVVWLPSLAALACRPHAPPSPDVVLLADARGDLPAARAEATQAARALGGEVHAGSDATLARVAAARHARLLHAAVHAGVDATGGGLELADGRLTGGEILARGITPALAVLTGCATGAGSDGERWGALPSALLAAGSQTVVATLRPVRDDDAAALIRGFYAAHGDRQPAAALATAQRARAHDAPLHAWAWFTVWGHAEPDECPAVPPSP